MVHKAKDVRLRRFVALKFLPESVAVKVTGMLQDFERRVGIAQLNQ